MEQPAAAPILVAERIEFIDILRGFALFGVLAANMRAFNAPIQIYGHIQKLFGGVWDLLAQGWIDAFISGKFVTLFSFVFGIGFAVQFMRAQARSTKFGAVYPRRLGALAVFGLIHGIVIWAGDILLSYALAGFLLFWFRKAKQKTILIWSGCILAVPMLIMTGFYVASRFGRASSDFGKPPDMKKIHRIIDIYANGSPLAIVRQNWQSWVESLPFLFFGVIMLCVFLLGLYVWRSGLIQNLAEHRPLLRRVCAWTLPMGLAINIAVVVIRNLMPQDGKPTLLGLLVNLVGVFGMLGLSCGYASGLALLYLKESWRRRLRPLGAVGRMPLTNYLMESVVLVLFYYSFTTGLYGKVGPAMGLIPTFALYAAQVWLSNWWMARFRFGPMEWLWRGLTYGRFPSMREEAAATAPS